MLPVETPFKIYTGLNGLPLHNGFVYFGQPGQNPITAPVTVYWDAAGTQPAAQPLRTTNGYIVRAGTPANVFFDGAYSELVKDSAGGQVFYARTSDDFSVATFVKDQVSIVQVQVPDYAALTAYAGAQKSAYVTGYLVTTSPDGIAGAFVLDDSDTTTPANGGTVIASSGGKRWKRVYSGSVDVRWFGAKLDGIHDDTTIIQAILDLAKGDEGVYPVGGTNRSVFSIYIPTLKGGYAKITDTLVIDGTYGLYLHGDGGYTKRPGGLLGELNTSAIRWAGATSKPVFQLKGQTDVKSNPNLAIRVDNLTIAGNPTIIRPGSVPANVALAGVYLGPLAGDNSNTLSRSVILKNVHITGCRFGVYSGNPAALNTDHAPITMENCNFFMNAQAGVWWSTGNAVGHLIGCTLTENGWGPLPADAYAVQKGANVYCASGYLDISSYTGAGGGTLKPVDADIFQGLGRVSVKGAWSDTQGYFFYQDGGGAPIAPGEITGVRHYAADMTAVDTPNSMRIVNPGMVVSACMVYGNIEVLSGQSGRPVFSGVTFVRAGATYTGSGVTAQRSLTVHGHGPGNAAQTMMGGRDAGVPLAHVGFDTPQILSLGTGIGNNYSLLQALAGSATGSGMSMKFNEGDGSLEIHNNIYQVDAGLNFRAHKAGTGFRIVIGQALSGGAIHVFAYQFADTVTTVAIGAFVDLGGIRCGGIPASGTEAVFMPPQRTAAPTFNSGDYWKGGIYFDTTLGKLRVNVGGVTWQTVTSV